MTDTFESIESKIAELSQQLRRMSNFLEAAPGVRSLYVGNDTVLTALRNGRKLYLDSQDIGIAPHIISRGIWEAANSREVNRLVGRGHVCIDIGANAGYYSVLMAGLVGPEGKVFSFEPNPAAYGLLVRSLEVNGYLRSGISKSYSCALSDHSGVGQLTFRDGNSGGGSLFIAETGRNQEDMKTIDVELRTLDSIPIPRDKPTFIKIDAEGAEYPILIGARRTLEEIPDTIVLLEFFPAAIRKHLSVDSYLDFLASFGFSFFGIIGQHLVLLTKADLLATANTYLFLARRDISSGPSQPMPSLP